jgi:hypothetical protein
MLFAYWQLVVKLIREIRVLQLKVPSAFKYSVVKKNVKSSEGSTRSEL